MNYSLIDNIHINFTINIKINQILETKKRLKWLSQNIQVNCLNIFLFEKMLNFLRNNIETS